MKRRLYDKAGSSAIFRGDYLHAGASYTILNRRLFLSGIEEKKVSKLLKVYNIQKKS